MSNTLHYTSWTFQNVCLLTYCDVPSGLNIEGEDGWTNLDFTIYHSKIVFYLLFCDWSRGNFNMEPFE